MTSLVAVDWGTSSLRAARIAADGTVIEERAGDRGILTVPAGGFPAVLAQFCGDWLAAPGVPCLVSGMAGSRQGWQEAPYAPCPAGFDEIARALTWVESGRVALVPGLCCEHDGVPDVIRGEEVQVFGALALQGATEGLLVLPGTHSKWVRVQDGRVTTFATCMSGEFYALLRTYSILARTLPADDGPLDTEAFLRGVRHARVAVSLLASAFSVRALGLFDALPAAAQPSYLSGLVIGEELRLHATGDQPITLIGSATLTERYALALADRGIPTRRFGAEATWHGLASLARALQRD